MTKLNALPHILLHVPTLLHLAMLSEQLVSHLATDTGLGKQDQRPATHPLLSLSLPPLSSHPCGHLASHFLSQTLGSWMTKIDALLRRLLLLRAEAPDEKALVFSQFPQALELVGVHDLVCHGVACCAC